MPDLGEPCRPHMPGIWLVMVPPSIPAVVNTGRGGGSRGSGWRGDKSSSGRSRDGQSRGESRRGGSRGGGGSRTGGRKHRSWGHILCTQIIIHKKNKIEVTDSVGPLDDLQSQFD
ncbi:hypothetical protein V8B97DRAFT_1917891 [Scleroderma yunnanense]